MEIVTQVKSQVTRTKSRNKLNHVSFIIASNKKKSLQISNYPRTYILLKPLKFQ